MARSQMSNVNALAHLVNQLCNESVTMTRATSLFLLLTLLSLILITRLSYKLYIERVLKSRDAKNANSNATADHRVGV